MSAKDRAALILKLHKVCKKHFDVTLPHSDRTVLEHMLYACCLEDSTFEAADEAFARLQEEYFDWNEVRVTTVAELALVCKALTNPEAGATRVKKALHGVFETYYQFDIDFLKKENLSKALTQFGRFRGVSDFVVSYTAQNGLGGHSIPIDDSFLFLMTTIGAISEAEATKRKITGLERTIPKNKGLEFSILVHQLAVAYFKSPQNKHVRGIILEVEPSSVERFPKRGAAKRAAAKAAAEAKKAEEDRIAKEKAEQEAEIARVLAEKEAAKEKIRAEKEAAKQKIRAEKQAAKDKIRAEKEKIKAKERAAKEKIKAKERAAKEKAKAKIAKEKERARIAKEKAKAKAAKEKAKKAKAKKKVTKKTTKKAAKKTTKKKTTKKKTSKAAPKKKRVVKKKKKTSPTSRLSRKKPR